MNMFNLPVSMSAELTHIANKYYKCDIQKSLNELISMGLRAKQRAEDLKDKERMLAIIKAVAHIGVDFGYGKYELEQEYIDMARAICEQEDLEVIYDEK